MISIVLIKGSKRKSKCKCKSFTGATKSYQFLPNNFKSVFAKMFIEKMDEAMINYAKSFSIK